MFAGGGGTTTALLQAFAAAGERVTLAVVNHAPLAVATLTANHPEATAYRAPIEDVIPRHVVPGGRLDLLAGSPSCTHFSKARGGLPRQDQQRATAWAIPRWLTELDVACVFLENVPEMQQWGPLTRRGAVIRARRGEYYQRWLEMIRALGYTIEARVVCAADYGDPTTRERLLLLGCRDGGPLRWPAPTHGPRSDGGPPWRTARSIVEWSLLGAPAAAKRLCPATRTRIALGLEKFGGEPFILRRRQFDNPPASDCRDIDQPLHTITAGSTDIALITPHRGQVYHRALGVHELARAMGFPTGYRFAGRKRDQVRAIGNAVPVGTARAHLTALLSHLAPGALTRAA